MIWRKHQPTWAGLPHGWSCLWWWRGIFLVDGHRITVRRQWFEISWLGRVVALCAFDWCFFVSSFTFFCRVLYY
jgi:hypothetical protein